MRALLLAATVAAVAGGCASWLPSGDRMAVQQGNVLSAADLEALHPGLTRSRVRELLGTPVLNAPFHRDRWDYVYYDVEAGRAVSPQRLTLFFEGDMLTRIVERYTPPDPEVLDEVPAGPPAPPDPGPVGPQPTPRGPGPPRPGPMPTPQG